MSDMVDLNVMGVADRLYRLQDDVMDEPPVDDVSRGDWAAARTAALILYWMIDDKLNGRPVRSPIDYEVVRP